MLVYEDVGGLDVTVQDLELAGVAFMQRTRQLHNVEPYTLIMLYAVRVRVYAQLLGSKIYLDYSI